MGRRVDGIDGEDGNVLLLAAIEDPEILFFDEPSSGLDPVSSKNMDDLILALRDGLGSTIVVVSHELSSIFTIADNTIYLDPETKRVTAEGKPNDILRTSKEKSVIDFLTRLKSTN